MLLRVCRRKRLRKTRCCGVSVGVARNYRGRVRRDRHPVAAVVDRDCDEVRLSRHAASDDTDVLLRRRRRHITCCNCLLGCDLRPTRVRVPRGPLCPVNILSRGFVITYTACSPSVVSALSVVHRGWWATCCRRWWLVWHTYSCCTAFNVSMLNVSLQVSLRKIRPSATCVLISRATV